MVDAIWHIGLLLVALAVTASKIPSTVQQIDRGWFWLKKHVLFRQEYQRIEKLEARECHKEEVST